MTAPHPKLVELLDKMLSGYDPVLVIVESETARGFKVVRPGDAPWFRATDWRAESVASINGIRARLVLLHAFNERAGALTRTLAAIGDAGLMPVVVEPTRELGAALARRGWKPRQEGSTFEDRETIWYAGKGSAQRLNR
jgi:hypothetical protein